METRWSADNAVGPDVLKPVLRSFTLETIMTPRAHLAICLLDESASAVMDRNNRGFSFMPVVDEVGRFLGVYEAEGWFRKQPPNRPTGDDFEPFQEHVTSADPSIVEFVT